MIEKKDGEGDETDKFYVFQNAGCLKIKDLRSFENFVSLINDFF